jgi:PKD repeat protein
MDFDFRDALKDSFGNSLKMTWFVEMDHYVFNARWPQEENVSGLGALLEIMRNHWSPQIETYGDELAYHHHFLYWQNWWVGFYPGIDSLPDTYTFHDDYLDRMIVDYNFYPSTFRSGWNWLNENISIWLDKWLLYDFSEENVSNAYFPYHPEGFNFWRLARSADIESAFVNASQGVPAILLGVGHNEIYNIASDLGYVHQTLVDFSAQYGVQFRYCSAREAMQRYLMDLGCATDMSPPSLSINKDGDNYLIQSNESLWMDHPRVTAKYTDDTYAKIAAIPVGTNTWNASIPALNAEGASLEKVGVAALDVWGNPATAIYLPSYIRDARILNMATSLNVVVAGTQLELNVTLKNEGSIPDTFNVMLYQNQTLIKVHEVANIAPEEIVVVNFTWNTSGTEPGKYLVWTKVPQLPGETDIEDNVCDYGIITVTAPPTAVFSYSPMNPQPFEQITFNASASAPNGGSIVNYTWNFDGYAYTTIDQIVTCAFNASGIYNVTLTVLDDENLSDSTSTLISVGVSLEFFGYNSSLKEGWYDSRYHIVGGRYACPKNGSAKNITVYIKNLGEAKRAKCGLYLSNQEGKIGTLKAFTEERIIPISEGWQSFSFSANPSVLLEANQTYWIVIFVEWAGTASDEHGFLVLADHSGPQDVFGGRWYPYEDFPTEMPQDQMYASDWKCSIYTTYTPMSP